MTMEEYHLKSPFTEEDIRKLRVGDIVYFDGLLFGIRDLTQIYMFDQNHKPPVSLAGAPCIHTAPSLRKVDGKWEKICIGTTTSTRMERFTPESDLQVRRTGHHRQGRPVPGQPGGDAEVRRGLFGHRRRRRGPGDPADRSGGGCIPGSISTPRPSTSSG